MLLRDKVIIVTGAGSGIGRATAQILAACGAKVVAADLDEHSANETASLIALDGGVAQAIGTNVALEKDVVAMVDRAIGAFGRLDGACNNAGLPRRRKLVEDLDEDDWNAVMEVNLKGVFLCMKHEISAMRRSGGGAIVNTSSGFGTVASPYAAEYCASKSGVLGLTRGAAAETAITRVRVNAVLPGMIVTPMTAAALDAPDFKTQRDAALQRHSIGRFGKPDDIGYAVKWLLSDEASFMNGASIAVDGGYTAG